MKQHPQKYENELKNKLTKPNTLIITGPTGCGKSTIIPVLLHKMFPEKTIALIQPRRLAVTTLYHFLKDKIPINYKIRFEAESNNSNITIMTDGMFLKEYLYGKKYDIVILDEVHEKNLRTEMILAILKSIIMNSAFYSEFDISPKSNAFSTNKTILKFDDKFFNTKTKIILMSATLETKKLQDFFSADLFEFKTHAFKCQLFYEDEPISDYITHSYLRIKKIVEEFYSGKCVKTHKRTKLGQNLSVKIKDSLLDTDASYEKTVFYESDQNLDNQEETLNIESKINVINKDILVFLPGEEDINDLARLLKRLPHLRVIKIFSTANKTEESKLYQLSNEIKVILSTNICETSITIPGVLYVIDSGLCKVKIFNGVESFGITEITKESAQQRMGRCNRTADGICFRMYTEESFRKMRKATPEIQKSNLDYLILYFLSRQALLFKPRNVNMSQRLHDKNNNVYQIEGRQQRKMSFSEVQFLDFPNKTNFYLSVGFLQEIGALKSESKKTNLGVDILSPITKLQISSYGKQLMKIPLEINLSHFLLTANSLNCGIWAAKCISLISQPNFNFLENVRESNKTDILYLCELFDEYLMIRDKYTALFKQGVAGISESKTEYASASERSFFFKHLESLELEFCEAKKIKMVGMQRALLIYKQLSKTAEGKDLSQLECAFSRAFKHNEAILRENGEYRLRDTTVFISPNSYFFTKRCRKIVFIDVLCTTKAYCRIVGKSF
ncbi:putative pre-mRNA-splicing factor ATP-dependent RNA helicase mog-1 [Cucumispora dikerogammari]|nr:putative pre-mRNA-splicing factor ATP-dependent RNA helicase mog-1 [Cucumispora dikerogammari]